MPPTDPSQRPLNYVARGDAPDLPRAPRSAGTWILLLLVWGLGLVIWGFYLILIGYLFLRIFA